MQHISTAKIVVFLWKMPIVFRLNFFEINILNNRTKEANEANSISHLELDLHFLNVTRSMLYAVSASG